VKHQFFWLALSLLILIVTLHLRLSEPFSINVDGAFHLQCAQLILAGKLPYVGVFDNNPPLSMYLHMIPCLVATMFGAHSITCFNIVVWLVAVVSLLWCARILAMLSGSLPNVNLGLLLVAMSLITFNIGADYGQREHLFVSCTLPLLLVRWMRWHQAEQKHIADQPAFASLSIKTYECFAVGSFAAFALLLKPHFLIPFIAAECAWYIHMRNSLPKASLFFVPEVAGCFTLAVLYALHFALLPAPARDSFFGNIVPLVIHGYGAYDNKLVDLLSMSLPVFYGGICYGIPFFIPGFALALSVIAVAMRKKCSFLMPLTAFTLGGYAVFVLQHKGWSNHTIPMLAGCFLLSALELGLVVDFRGPSKRFLASSCAVVTWLVFLIAAGCRNEAPLYEDPEMLKDLIAYTQPGDKVLVLSAVLYPAYPLLTQLDRQPGSRYLHLFPLPMLEYWKARTSDLTEKQRLEHEEQKVLDNVTEDIGVNKPRLIAIETKPLDRGDGNFTVSSYLERHQFTDNSLRRYSFVRDSGTYLLYKRMVD